MLCVLVRRSPTTVTIITAIAPGENAFGRHTSGPWVLEPTIKLADGGVEKESVPVLLSPYATRERRLFPRGLFEGFKPNPSEPLDRAKTVNEPFEIRYDVNDTLDALEERIERACDGMECIYKQGAYPKLTVKRSWSSHNPVIAGEMARPSAYRWYLRRELRRLALKGAEIRIASARPRIDLSSPALLDALDESDWDLRKKKLFLFDPERIDISVKRLEHYTGSPPENFQRYILLTNYGMHVEAFQRMYPDCIQPSRPDVQMPAYHCQRENQEGVTLVNIGVGPSNAKTATDHIAVLRPDAMIMVGHCGGIRNHQEIGDFVLASGYMRADRVLDERLPTSVPIVPSDVLNRYLALVLQGQGSRYRLGTVYTTADRNWEFARCDVLADLRLSRSVAIDMESATVAANGFRYRIPNATLLCVSDKPLHGQPKLPESAEQFYRDTQDKHISIAVRALQLVSEGWPTGLPTSTLRATDEPLMGGTSD